MPRPTSRARRFPVAVALVCGFLHGLGFAGALNAVGLPAADVPLALVAFNVGVEAGQIGIVSVWLGLAAALRIGSFGFGRRPRAIAVYAMGSTAALFLFERVTVLF